MKKLLKRSAYTLLVLIILLNILFIWQAFIFTHFAEASVSKQSSGFIIKKASRLFGKQHPRQFVVDSLTVPHQTLTINSGGLKLAAWHLKHGADTAKGTIIMFHGYNGSRSEIIPEATAFYKMNYNVFMIDFRGHGLSQGNVCSMGYYESGDVKSAYDYIKGSGEKNIVLWGGSMGAVSLIKAMHDYKEIKPSKIIIERSFAELTDAVEGLVRNTMHWPQQPVATILTFWGSVEQGAWLFSVKPYKFVSSITCPVLVQWGTTDELVSKDDTQTLYKNLGSSEKKLVVYQGLGHENFLPKQPALWLASVSNFLNTSAVPQSPVNK